MTGITIQEYVFPDTGNVRYSIIGDSSCEFSSYKWFHSGSTGVYLVGSNNYYTTTSPPSIGDKIWVNVSKYSQTYWNGGEFYGGNFLGNFGGGTFHYGQLNDCYYLKQEIKIKPFIEDIQLQTGPSNIKK